MTIISCAQLSDPDLLDHVTHAAAAERGAVVNLLILLGEIDARRLFLPEGCSSLFTYCTQVLRFSEHEAYHRIEAARVARMFPIVLDELLAGALTQSSITVLRPHLTVGNADALIASARHKSKREVEQQMAALAPKPDAKSMVRRVPDAKPIARLQTPSPIAENVLQSAASADPPVTQSSPRPEPRPLATPPSPRPISAPLSADRYLLRVTVSAEAHAKLKRAQDLLRHAEPGGDPAAIIERALTLLVEDLERRRLARVKTPRMASGGTANSTGASSRHIAAAVRREVWARDTGRCAFVGRQGRCRETGGLEFHHVNAFAFGGESTTENLEIRCRAHNQYEGALLFGPRTAAVHSEAPARPGPS